jgi:hypothetical protein
VFNSAYTDATAMLTFISCPVCLEDRFLDRKHITRHMKLTHNRPPTVDEYKIIGEVVKVLHKVKRVISISFPKGLSDAERKHCAPSSDGSAKKFKCVSCGDDVSKVDLINHMHTRHGVDQQLCMSWAMYKDSVVLRFGSKYKKPKNEGHCIFERLFHKAGGDADESSDDDGEDDQNQLGEEDSGHSRWQKSEWAKTDSSHSDYKTSDWEASDWNASGGKWHGEDWHTQDQSWKDSEWCKSSGDWWSSQPASWDSDAWESGSKSYNKDDGGKRQDRSIMIRLRSN